MLAKLPFYAIYAMNLGHQITCLTGGGGGLSDKCTYMYAHLYILL